MMILWYIKYHKRSPISEQVFTALYVNGVSLHSVLYMWDKHGHISAVHTAPAPFKGHTPSHHIHSNLYTYSKYICESFMMPHMVC